MRIRRRRQRRQGRRRRTKRRTFGRSVSQPLTIEIAFLCLPPLAQTSPCVVVSARFVCMYVWLTVRHRQEEEGGEEKEPKPGLCWSRICTSRNCARTIHAGDYRETQGRGKTQGGEESRGGKETRSLIVGSRMRTTRFGRTRRFCINNCRRAGIALKRGSWSSGSTASSAARRRAAHRGRISV